MSDCPKCGYPNTANGSFKGIYTSGKRCNGCSYLETTNDEIPLHCVGERCSQCNSQAFHKIEECVEHGYRHPYTTYVCKNCFNKIMRPNTMGYRND